MTPVPPLRLSREQATSRLVAAATQILATRGPAALKARTVADVAGLSTSAVYHHVGGVPDLLRAVCDRGFDDLAARFTDLELTDDPTADLFRHALAVRTFALENPHLYDLMFGLSIRGTYRPSPQLAEGRRSDSFLRTYDHLRQACGRVQGEGRLRASADVTAVADQLWSAVHGFVTLELAGHLAHRSDPVREVLAPATINILVGEGDARPSATASHASVVVAPQQEPLA